MSVQSLSNTNFKAKPKDLTLDTRKMSGFIDYLDNLTEDIISLDFSRKVLKKDGVIKLVEYLLTHPNITQIILTDAQIELTDLLVLSTGFANIRELHLPNTEKIGTLFTSASFVRDSNIETIKLDCSQYNDIFDFAKYLTVSSLVKLDITASVKTGALMKSIAGHPTLTNVDFGYVSSDLVHNLAKAVNLKDIKISLGEDHASRYKELIKSFAELNLSSVEINLAGSLSIVSSASTHEISPSIFQPLINKGITSLKITGMGHIDRAATLEFAHMQSQFPNVTLEINPFVSFIKRVFTEMGEGFLSSTISADPALSRELRNDEHLLEDFFLNKAIDIYNTPISELRDFLHISNILQPLLDLTDSSAHNTRDAGVVRAVNAALSSQAKLLVKAIKANTIESASIFQPKLGSIAPKIVQQILQALEDTTNLKTLEVRTECDSNMGKSIAKTIANNQGLHDLTFTSFTARTFDELGESIAEHEVITKVTFQNCNLIHIEDSVFRALLQNKHIANISLVDATYTNSKLIDFINNNPELSELTLTPSQINEKLIMGIRLRPTPLKIKLDGNINELTLAAVQSLNPYGVDIECDKSSFIKFIAKLYRAEDKNTEIQRLYDGDEKPNLELLKSFFVNSEITDTTRIQSLVDFEHLSSSTSRYDFNDLIKVLNTHLSLKVLSYNNANTPKNQYLESSVSLKSNPKRMRSDAANDLFDAISNNHILEEFSLNDVRIYNLSAQRLSKALNNSPNLKKINFKKLNVISGNKDSRDFKPIADVGQALAHKLLTYLNLEESNLASDFINSLGESTTLTHLALTNSDLHFGSREKFDSLISSNKLPNLTHLKLDILDEKLIEALKTNTSISHLTIDNILESDAILLTSGIEDGSIHVLWAVEALFPMGQLRLLQAAATSKILDLKLQKISLEDISLDTIAESIVTTARSEEEIVEYLKLLKSLGFNNWAYEYGEDKVKILEIILMKCEKTSSIIEIIDMLPVGEAVNVGITSTAIDLITESKASADELYDILGSLNKFTNVPLFSLISTIIEGLDEDFPISIVLEAHPDIQNSDIVLALAKNVNGLKKFENILLYRQTKYGLGLENDEGIITYLKKHLTNGEGSLVETVEVINRLGFNLWDFTFIGTSFVEALLGMASNSSEISEILNILPSGNKDKAGLHNKAINIILDKDFSKEELYYILKLLSGKFTNIDLTSIAKEILEHHHRNLSEFLAAHGAYEDPKMLTELASGVRSLKQYQDIMRYRKEAAGVGIDSETYREKDLENIKRLLSETHLDEYAKNAAYSKLEQERESHLQTPSSFEDRQEQYLRLQKIGDSISVFGAKIFIPNLIMKTLVDLGFNQWHYEFADGKNIFNIVLEKTANSSEVLKLLEATSTLEALVINNQAIKSFIAKSDKITIQTIVQILCQFKNFNIADLIEPIQSSALHIESVTFTELIGSERAQILLSNFISHVASFSEFVRLKAHSQNIYHIQKDDQIGELNQPMVKYLPLSITNFKEARNNANITLARDIADSISKNNLDLYLESLIDAGFDIWEQGITAQANFLQLVLQNLSNLSGEQIFLCRAKDFNIDFSLDNHSLDIIFSKAAKSGAEAVELVETLHRFDHIEWAHVVSKIMVYKDADFNLYDFIVTHEELQDPTTLTKLAGQVHSLGQYIDIMNYRNEKFGISLNNEEYRLRELNNIENLLAQEKDPIAIFKTLLGFGFDQWGSNAGEYIFNGLLAKSADISSANNLLETALLLGVKVSLNKDAITTIFSKHRATQAQLQETVKMLEKYDSDWVTIIHETFAHKDINFYLYTLINLHKELQDGAVLTKLVGEVHSLAQFIDIMQYRSENLGISLESTEFKQQDLENIKNLVTKENNPIAIFKSLIDLDFKDWGGDEWKDILSNLLNKCTNITQVEALLHFAEENKIAFELDAAKIDIIVSKDPASRVSPAKLLEFFNKYQSYDSKYLITKILVKCNNKAEISQLLDLAHSDNINFELNAACIDVIFGRHPHSTITPKDIIWQFRAFEVDWLRVAHHTLEQIRVDARRGTYQLPNYLPYQELLTYLPPKISQLELLISKFVPKVESLEEFKALMIECGTRFGVAPNILVGEMQNHIITFLPRKLVDFKKLSNLMESLGTPIHWKYVNSNGSPLFAEMIQRVNTNNIENNIKFLLQTVTDVDWNASLTAGGTQDNLLLAIASASDTSKQGRDLKDIWNLILNLLSETGDDRLPQYNVNYQNKVDKGERLIDKAKTALDGILAGQMGGIF